MRIQEFNPKQPVDLFEINMRSTNLERLAKQIEGVRVGMEFEMCVPDAMGVEFSEPEREREDEPTSSLEDIKEFFSGGNNNSRSVTNLMYKLDSRWSDWLDSQAKVMWERDKKEFVRDYLYLNDIDGAQTMSDKEFEELFERTIDNLPEQIYDEYRAVKSDELTVEEFLDDIGLDTMYDVYYEYDHIIDWPYWTEPEPNEEINGEDVAESFSDSVGVNAIYSSDRYENVNKTDWRVEPDGSISTNDVTDTGLEFVTPDGGLALEEMLGKMELVKKWADSMGCYTNSSTGLHISVSIPKYSISAIDYVKLVLLLGDNYILDVFNRRGNRYARSSFDYINKEVAGNPSIVTKMFEKMRGVLDQFASRLISSTNPQRTFSINLKHGYIEFRSPGGEWLDDKFWNQVKPTMLRFIVALDAASDPRKYREEYLKKLYKLLGAHNTKQGDITQLFAKYVAKEIPRSALVSFVRQAQTQRNISRGLVSGQKYWWKVELPGTGYSIEVVGKDAEEAKQRALDSTPEWASQRVTTDRLRATPVRPYDLDTQRNELEQSPQQTQYDVYMVDNPNQIIGRFFATTRETARIAFRQYLHSIGRESPGGYGFREATQ